MCREGNLLARLIRNQIERVGAFVCAVDLRATQSRRYMIILTRAEVHRTQWQLLTSQTHAVV